MLQKAISRIFGRVVALFFPREATPEDLAAKLDAANKEIERLQQIDQERIRNEAARIIAEEVIPGEIAPPEVEIPQQQYYERPPQSRQEGFEHPQPEAPSVEQELQSLKQQFNNFLDHQEMLRIDGEIRRAQEKYPSADRLRVVSFLAQHPEKAPNANIEKLMEMSHRVREGEIQSRLEAERKKWADEIRGQTPPPVPGAAQGIPSETPKVTSATATRTFSTLLKQKLGWGT